MAAKKAGSVEVEIKADISEMKAALSEIRMALREVDTETKRSAGDFGLLGIAMKGTVIGIVSEATRSMIDFTKSLVEFASASPDMAIATAELNEELRIMANEIGPEAADVVSSFTDLMKNVWDDVKDPLKSLLSYFADDLIPVIETAWDLLTGDRLREAMINAGFIDPGEEEPITGGSRKDIAYGSKTSEDKLTLGEGMSGMMKMWITNDAAYPDKIGTFTKLLIDGIAGAIIDGIALLRGDNI